MAQVFPPQKKQVIQAALFAPPRFLFIDEDFLIANAGQHLARLLGLLKEFSLFLAGALRDGQVLLELAAVTLKLRVAVQSEAQFRGCRARSQFFKLRRVPLLPSLFRDLDQMPHPRHLLVRRAQPQFLLVLQAFAKMQHRLQ